MFGRCAMQLLSLSKSSSFSCKFWLLGDFFPVFYLERWVCVQHFNLKVVRCKHLCNRAITNFPYSHSVARRRRVPTYTNGWPMDYRSTSVSDKKRTGEKSKKFASAQKPFFFFVCVEAEKGPFGIESFLFWCLVVVCSECGNDNEKWKLFLQQSEAAAATATFSLNWHFYVTG